MTAFRTPTDIGSRAAQHCGQPRLDPTLGFGDTSSKAASEIGFVYDKLREAELQRRIWTFATRRQVLRPIDNNTMLLAPALWVSVAIYFVGSIVSDEAGGLWISRTPNNLGNDPLLTTAWEPYFGPMALPLYDASGTTAYQAGELVYTAPGNGTALVYLSLQNGNSDVPATATSYDPTVTYFKNQVVTFNSIAYMSLIDLNIANEPDLAPALWFAGTTYASAARVTGSDGIIYASINNGNIGHDPTLDLTHINWTSTGTLSPWTTVFVGGTGSLRWLLIGGTAFPNGVSLTTLNIVYPQGTGPSTESTSDNVYRLPAGYLRLAPQNSKPGLNSLGGPSGVSFNDWIIEGDYLISSDCTPITMRFVVNITDVAKMHTMFCEGLAARIGLEVCEPLTQSTAKVGTIGKIYDRWISEAGMVDAIEDGYEDPPDDDLITCRL